MQINHSRAYGPDQLRTLQGIFDDVCRELGANGTFHRPKDPETLHGGITRRVMRYEIGRQVMSYAHNDQMTEREITKAVVNRMTNTYRAGLFRKLGETLHQANPRTPTVVRKEIKSP